MTRAGLALPLVVIALACHGADKSGAPPDDSTAADSTTDDTSTSPPAEETCNGNDDDGDGMVDEGYEDVDANGVADCVQSCVTVAVAKAASVPANPGCVPWDGEPVEDPWNVEKVWEVAAENVATGDPFMAGTVPLVLPAALADRIVTVGWDRARGNYDGRVLIVAADGSSVRFIDDVGWDSPGPGSVAGDVDGDGDVELFTELNDGSVTALDMDGATLWVSPAPSFQSGAPLVLTDIQGDGAPELIDQDRVYNARTGDLLLEIAGLPALYNGQVVTADLDLDGVQEILLAGVVADASGNHLWESDVTDGGELYPVVVQADLDPEGEVVWVGMEVRLYDTDGDPLADAVRLRGHAAGPPCAGDLDGDGRMELVVATSVAVSALELDGTPLWTKAKAETGSVGGGCATSDLDGDGKAEVLYAQGTFSILDGATGATLYADPSPPPLAGFTNPVPVDLDGDGHAEIVVVGGDPYTNGTPTIVVYGHAGSRITKDANPSWTPAGTTWMTHDASGGERNEDGTIPTNPEPAWSRYGMFRGRLAGPDAHLSGSTSRWT